MFVYIKKSRCIGEKLKELLIHGCKFEQNAVTKANIYMSGSSVMSFLILQNWLAASDI